jgi:hypothetical protein
MHIPRTAGPRSWRAGGLPEQHRSPLTSSATTLIAVAVAGWTVLTVGRVARPLPA